MKSIKKTFDMLLKLGTCALGGLYLINYHIRKQTEAENVLTDELGDTYNWDHTSIYYETYGNSDDAVLLLHDLVPSASGYDVKELAAKLSADHTVYVVDLPGCGRSDKPSITYTNYYYVQFLHAFIGNVIKKPVTILAEGLSGSVALTAASLYKEEIHSVYLLDPWSLAKLAAVPDDKSNIVRTLLSLPVIGESIYNIKYTKEQIEFIFSDHMFFNPFKITKKQVSAGHAAAHMGNGNGRFLLASLDGKYLNWNMNRILANAVFPITVIYGEKSRDGALTAKQYQEINHSVNVISISNAEHALAIENTEYVAKILA